MFGWNVEIVGLPLLGWVVQFPGGMQIEGGSELRYKVSVSSFIRGVMIRKAYENDTYPGGGGKSTHDCVSQLGSPVGLAFWSNRLQAS